jgi:hypothetical protein
LCHSRIFWPVKTAQKECRPLSGAEMQHAEHVLGSCLVILWRSFWGTLALQSWGSSVTIVTRLRAGGTGLNSRLGAGIFSLHHGVRTGCEAHPVSYPMDSGSSSPRSKATGGREADCSLPCRADVKNAWTYTSNCPYVFMAW